MLVYQRLILKGQSIETGSTGSLELFLLRICSSWTEGAWNPGRGRTCEPENVDFSEAKNGWMKKIYALEKKNIQFISLHRYKFIR